MFDRNIKKLTWTSGPLGIKNLFNNLLTCKINRIRLQQIFPQGFKMRVSGTPLCGVKRPFKKIRGFNLKRFTLKAPIPTTVDDTLKYRCCYCCFYCVFFFCFLCLFVFCFVFLLLLFLGLFFLFCFFFVCLFVCFLLFVFLLFFFVYCCWRFFFFFLFFFFVFFLFCFFFSKKIRFDVSCEFSAWKTGIRTREYKIACRVYACRRRQLPLTFCHHHLCQEIR